jgi:hypothetical protein
MAGAKPAKSPCLSGSKLYRFDRETLLDPSEYQSVVGALQYYTLTCPDIAFSILNESTMSPYASSNIHALACCQNSIVVP